MSKQDGSVSGRPAVIIISSLQELIARFEYKTGSLSSPLYIRI